MARYQLNRSWSWLPPGGCQESRMSCVQPLPLKDGAAQFLDYFVQWKQLKTWYDRLTWSLNSMSLFTFGEGTVHCYIVICLCFSLKLKALKRSCKNTSGSTRICKILNRLYQCFWYEKGFNLEKKLNRYNFKSEIWQVEKLSFEHFSDISWCSVTNQCCHESSPSL